MTSKVIVLMLIIHISFWLIQVGVNQLREGEGCEDVSNFACGSQSIIAVGNFVEKASNVNSILGTLGFVGDGLKSAVELIAGLLFFRYTWMSGGGPIIDIVVGIIQAFMGAAFVSLLRRAARGLRR